MNQINKVIAFGIFLALAVVSFIIIRPFLTGIFIAIFLAFIFRPLYNKINSKIKKPGFNALLITTLALLVIIIFTVVSLQIVANQVMTFYAYTKTTDITAPLKALIVRFTHIDPTQFAFLFDTALEKGTAAVVNYFSNLIFDLPLIIMQGIVAFFTMFYFLKDGDQIVEYCKGLLPFKEEVKNKFIERFKEVTKGVIYGSIVVGIFQGLTAGIGFYLFGVKGTFVLTLMAIVLSILPLGPWILWIPIGLDMLISGNTARGIGLLIYGIVVVSYIDNIIKPHLIGNKIKLSPVITIIGMLGGSFVFGFMGLFVGPVILAYLMLFMEFYRSSIKEII